MTWHQQSTQAVVDALRTSVEGLTTTEAERRLCEHGPNVLAEGKRRTPLGMFFDQFTDFMILVLLAAAVVSGVIGEAKDTIAIVAIVILNAVIGFVQEYRAERAMEALRAMAAPAAVVLRNGGRAVIPASDVVPGDVVILEAGAIVPADLRLFDMAQLRIDEAALTGESVPVEKVTAPLHEELLSVGDRKNMAYKGTVATYGRGSGVVVATGMQTEFGKIATLLQKTGEGKTPLQKRLAGFGRHLAIAALAICAIIFMAGILRGEAPLLMFLTAGSLAVAAIPEALPAVVTISLAIGARKMVQKKALVRKLPAVETLGSVTYICSDKTGTLTMNRMQVEEFYCDGTIVSAPGSGDPWDEFLRAMALSNDASVNTAEVIVGDPTEAALFMAARLAGMEKREVEKDYPRVAEIPFDSERKCMTTLHRDPAGGFVSFTKGAVEVIIERSSQMLTSSGTVEIRRDHLETISERMAADGLRVLAVGLRRWAALPATVTPETVERELTLLGFVGIMDPPREEAREAVATCRAAGIIPVMITGDHALTARAIARRLGILDDDGDAVMTGPALATLSQHELEARVEKVRVYARVAPEQKLKIVKALQARGEFVAMTGDGVNDAPALKQADIGVAMGITGTDVAKEASSMILLDDNFATIVRAVREGRKIYDNMRRFIKYGLTTNSGEVWTIFLAPFFGLPIPLLPIQILWINLVTDGLPGLALAAEPEERDVMGRPPRPPQEGVFSHGLGIHVIWVGLLMAALTLSAEGWFTSIGSAHWQTVVFTVLCLSQLGHVLAIRSERESLLTQGLLTNIPLLGAVVLTFLLQMATIYLPILNGIFKTEPLSPVELALALGVSSVIFFAVEGEKWLKRRADRRNAPALVC
ncbi:ATPase [Candidatus Methylomirabilis limnetica]|uniref:ATPase n=1 Tax=Candidatus Methylomirabilis limnetica TaxID=2033718 RepID=A0A2T4TWR9_9BACT|nr:cation-translocating P-type ATPase [Candidatus Methylomirabilis limnetica]PTL35540.1 ATPase [Candidatus Methylomirabilis limnetica]